MKDIGIKTEKIQLDQFLKLADLVESGGQVAMIIADGDILVNNKICNAKRKKLYPGDVVTLKGNGTYRVVEEI